MSWLETTAFERRPLVFVEDHLYHTSEMLAALHTARPDLLGMTTVCAVGHDGPDTDATVQEWLTSHPTLQVAAVATTAPPRVRAIGSADLCDAAAFARLIVRLLRPGGVLVQDVQLSTLPFLPADRWWESIYLAATIRGMFPGRAPHVRFLSNKRGYSATFGRDLLDAGFDPRDVMDKSALTSSVVPTLGAAIDRAFPFELDSVDATARRAVRPVAAGEDERQEIEAAFDLLLWQTTAETVELAGRLVDRLPIRANGHEVITWCALIADRLAGGSGVPVLAIGERIGPDAAERAELTNLAARHIHALRGRVRDAGAIVTASHAYRLSELLAVGLVRRRTLGRSPS